MFCYLNLAGITKLKYDSKNEWIRLVISQSDAVRLLPINNHIVTHPVSPNFPQRNTTNFNRRRRKEGQNLLHLSIFHQGRIVSFSFKKTGSICLSFYFFRSIRSFSSNRTMMDGFK